MRRTLLALSLPLLVLSGCSGDGGADAADEVSTATSSATQETGTPSATPSSTAPSTTATRSPAPKPKPTPKAKPQKPRSTPASVRADVENVAVNLESFYRGGDYPRTLDAVKATLADAGLELSPGNRLGSYVYDDGAVEFTLCVEGDSGAWASYNTAPMTVQDAGTSGGCP